MKQPNNINDIWSCWVCVHPYREADLKDDTVALCSSGGHVINVVRGGLMLSEILVRAFSFGSRSWVCQCLR